MLNLTLTPFCDFFFKATCTSCTHTADSCQASIYIEMPEELPDDIVKSVVDIRNRKTRRIAVEMHYILL